MRTITHGTTEHTIVKAIDDRGVGNGNHKYSIEKSATSSRPVVLQEVLFQHGPVKENAINGIFNEDLLVIVIDRLEGFQSGDYNCRENAIAKTKIEEALMWLRKRTDDRKRRGVEGTSQK